MQSSFSEDEHQHPYDYEEQWEGEEHSQQEEEEQNSDDENYQQAPQSNSPVKKNNTKYTYQAQKIIINDLEEEVESPTYRDFFEKGQKVLQTLPTENEDLENKKSQPRRWEILYERAKGSKQAKEELRKEYESQRVDPECTFKPKIMSSYNNKILYTTETMENDNALSIHERNKLWKSRVDNKLFETRETFKDQDLIGCTFKPNITKSQITKEYSTRGLTSYGSKGIDLYLRRRIIANQHREEKEKILENPLAKLPSHVYKKEGNITIPKGPDFNKGKPVEINSLKKPMEFPTPKPVDKYSTLENLSPERSMSPQKKSQLLVDPVRVGNVKFGEAIQKLHHALHRMNIN